jgi:hypothetical protein
MLSVIKKILLLEWMPTNFVIRFFLILIAIIIVQKISGVGYITDTFALGMMVYVGTLIGLNNVNKKINGGKHE